MRWIDISQPFHEKTTTWEGDLPFTYTLAFSKEQTGSVNLGRIATSVHTGTHIDAPFHFDSLGETVEQLDVNEFIGIAQVVHVIDVPVIEPEHLTIDERAQFILLRTTHNASTTAFPKQYSTLSPRLGPHLKEANVSLIGVDTPTIDPVDSKTLDAHHALYASRIHILENIVLDEAAEGLYDCIALPLRIDGADGSPVRAVIRPIE